MDKTADDEPIITPAHLTEMLSILKKQMKTEGETATAPALNYGYLVALVEYAGNEHNRAEQLQNELDNIGRFNMSSLVHNGGGSSD